MGGGVRGEGGGKGNKYAQHMRERRMEDEERLINERIHAEDTPHGQSRSSRIGKKRRSH